MHNKTSYSKKRVVLEGCNSEWSQKHYLPTLLEMAGHNDIELWAIDINPKIKLSSNTIKSSWASAESLEKVHYIDKTSGYGDLSGINFVFIVTPDKYHCDIASSWLDNLAPEGKIYIEKPLDAYLNSALKLKTRTNETGKIGSVFGFDHYLARLYPFLQRLPEYLVKIGKLENLKINIVEASGIPTHRVQTLERGVIFDLFCHALVVAAAILKKQQVPIVDILRAVSLDRVSGSRYINCPIGEETRAEVEFHIGSNIPVTSKVGYDKKEEKCLSIYGKENKHIEVCFRNGSVTVCGKQKKKLDPEPIESFLKAVFNESDKIDSAPGVMSFEAAFAVLEKLCQAKEKIIMGPDYDIGKYP